MNADRKKTYIDYKKSEATISRALEAWFKTGATFEQKYGKDMAEWSTEEIMSYMRFLNTTSPQVLIGFCNAMKMYTDWCMTNGFAGVINPYATTQITTEMICSCIDYNRFSAQLIKKGELEQRLKKIVNLQDRVIIWSFFYGLNAYEIHDMCLSDLNKNKLHVKGERDRTIKINSEFADSINKSILQSKFISYGINRRELPYIEPDNPNDPNIVRLILTHKGISENYSVHIGDRFRKIIEDMDLPPFITRNSLCESGRIYYVWNYMKSNNLTVHEALSASHRKENETIYGKIQQLTIWIMTYGKWMNENYGKEVGIDL